MKTINRMRLQLLQLSIFILISSAGAAQLRAGFSATPLTGCPPMVVSFKDSSKGNPTAWKWDLGNGTTSFLQNPIATYFTPGSYNVKLVVTSAGGKDSTIKNQYIVVNAVPVAKFGVSDSTGCFPLKVLFTDSSLAGSGSLVKWQWDFGDGNLSTAQNPVHSYSSPGIFTVILRIVNSMGCAASITKPAFINIQNGVKANFSYTTVAGCQTPSPFNFINESIGTGALTYRWDFGDGKTSTQTNPTNNYNAGIFTVKLIATSSFGCSDTIIKPNAINVGLIHADFTFKDSICAGSAVQLTNTSTPSNFTGALWNFGDGSSSTEINPAKTFTTPGLYKIKLVAAFGQCKDSIAKQVTVLSAPTAGFSALNVSGCAGPLNVSFKDSSIKATSYNWSFGDGAASNLQNPVHSYTTMGSFSVALTVTNGIGCSATIVKDKFVNLLPLTIQSLNNLGAIRCAPISISPNATIAGNHPVASYLWDFGDGTSSTLAKPTHTYTTAGKYDVKLVIVSPEGCTASYIYKDAVIAGSRPNTKFSADQIDVCAFTPVSFTDLSTNATVDQWQWSFGDGGNAAVQNPKYVYKDTGYFNVSLITSNSGCYDTLKIEKYIHIRPPVAGFDTSFFCNDPLKRVFIDKSIGANTWDWNFGDNTSSTEKSPTHTYAGPGNYPVILTVSYGQCQQTIKKDIVVFKERGTLSVSDSISCLNTQITFKANNINAANMSSYNWYFNGLGGSVTVTQNNPVTISYDKPGLQSAALVVADLLSCNDTIYAPVAIKIYGPKAMFSSANPNTCFGNAIAFADNSTTDGVHLIKEYVWDYGESIPQRYTAAPFSHDYAATGDYTVKMSVTDSYGCKDSVTKFQFVSITKPVAKFTVSDTAICPVLPITFTNNSVGVNATYRWDFADGTTSIDVSPVHAYSKPGSYKVRMVMVDKNGCTDSTSTLINVYSAKAAFAMSDSASTCPPLVVNLTNQSVNYTSLAWDFGDGGNSQLPNPSHIFTFPGNYTVKLLIKNNGGCFDTLTKKVTIQGPTGIFNYSLKEACIPQKVDYSITTKNTVNYVWDFDDGNTIFTIAPNASHTYINAGGYTPKVILEDAGGCKVAVQGVDTIKIYSVSTNIISDTRLVCDSGAIAFRDSTISNDATGSYFWNFGDGTTSTAKNPNHNFTDTGFYSVKLITTTRFGCKDSTFSKNYVKVVSAPQVKIIGDTTGCEPATILLAGGFLKKDTAAINWQWSFGNGNTSNLQNPGSQTFINSGLYNVVLKATNSDGCSGIVTKTAIIHSKPSVDAGPDAVICLHNSDTLNVTGAKNYTWRYSPSLSCTDCINPVATPDSTSTYYVVGKSLFGCENEDSVTIKVQQPFKILVNKADTLCKGMTLSLKASGADLYQWTPSLWLDNATVSSPKARPDTSIIYQVSGTDINGCFRDTQNVSIKVYPMPSIEITNGDIITVAIGGNVKLGTKNSADVVKWEWFPSQWLSCASCPEPLAAPKDNITYRVTATNEGKCAANDQVTINVICDNANVFMPNTFSPNADGVNDVFYPRGTGIFSVQRLKIFNRIGQVVFEKSGVSANDPVYGWDGNLNGVSLPSDVYVYLMEVICSNNQVFTFKGNVSLIR